MVDVIESGKAPQASETHSKLIRRGVRRLLGSVGLVLTLIAGYKAGQTEQQQFDTLRIENSNTKWHAAGAQDCENNMDNERSLGLYLLTFSDVKKLSSVENNVSVGSVNPALDAALSGNGVKHVRVLPYPRGSIQDVTLEMGEMSVVLDKLQTSYYTVFTTLLEGMSRPQGINFTDNDELLIDVSQVTCSTADIEPSSGSFIVLLY